MLNDQSTNNRLMNQHQIKKIILVLLNNQQTTIQPQQKTSRSMRSNNTLYQMRYQKESLIHIIINTRELDKGRGARTTSKKTLPTLVPLVMCFDCILIENTGQNKQRSLEPHINCINLTRNSMLIIQIEREVYFMDIKKLEKLSMLSKDYYFYERNKKLKENHN
jgi:hypothetical protein